MDRIRSSSEAPAVLAGSLAAFPLLDVLSLLATTRHVGELKVVSEGADDHFWVDTGDLIDTTGGATGRLFELACADDAWFTVTASTDNLGAGARMALSTVIEHLAPRLVEWQVLRASVPLDAVARMASSTSGPEVHVRADQWRVLSRLGGGRRVGDVVEDADGTPIETLRLLRELADAGLVEIESSVVDERVPTNAPRDTRRVTGTTEPGSGAGAGSGGANGGAGSKARTGGANGGTNGGAGSRAGAGARADRRAAPESPRDVPSPSSLMPSPFVTGPWAGSGAGAGPHRQS